MSISIEIELNRGFTLVVLTGIYIFLMRKIIPYEIYETIIPYEIYENNCAYILSSYVWSNTNITHVWPYFHIVSLTLYYVISEIEFNFLILKRVKSAIKIVMSISLIIIGLVNMSRLSNDLFMLCEYCTPTVLLILYFLSQIFTCGMFLYNTPRFKISSD